MVQILHVTFMILATVSLTWANSCSYHYKVPATSPTVCESSGGVDSVLEDKVDDIKGQLEGIKIVDGSNGHLITILQDNIAEANKQQEMAKSQLDNLQKEVENIKALMKVISDEEAGDTVRTAEDTSSVNPLSESNKILQNAIKEAEMKIFNMTNILRETARRRSIMTSVLMSRLLQQRQQIDEGWKKVQDLEKAILTGPSIKRTVQYVQEDERIFNLTSQTIDLLVKAAAAKEIMAAKRSDLEFKVDELDSKLQKEMQNMDSLRKEKATLDRATNLVNSTLLDVNNTFNNVKNNLIIQSEITAQQIPTIKAKIAKIVKDLSDVYRDVHNDAADKLFSKTLSKAKAQIGQLVTEVAALVVNITGQQSKLKNIEKEPLIILEEVLHMAQANYLKEKPLIDQMVNTVHGLNSTINSLRVPPLPQTGTGSVTPGRTPRKRMMRKQFLCGTM